MTHFSREWLIQPLTVNAFHNPTTNEISKISYLRISLVINPDNLVFPLGILRHPMFNLNYPMWAYFSIIDDDQIKLPDIYTGT